MFRKRISLIAPHSIAECKNLLSPHIDTSFIKDGFQSFVGKLTETKLRIRKRIHYRNGYQTVLDARLLPSDDESQTVIAGHIGLQIFAIWYGLIWTSGVLLGIIFLSIPSIIEYLSTYPKPQTEGIFIGIFVPPCMLLFSILLVTFGRWLARHEEAQLRAFLQETIQAVPNADNNAV